MSDQPGQSYQTEVKAIGEVLGTLEALSGPARERVLAYVTNALNIGLPSVSAGTPTNQPVVLPSSEIDQPPPKVPAPPLGHTDIRSLGESKQPKSAVEMAAVVAYYLSEIAPEGERRESVGTADLDKYFKQAGFRLPKAQNMTLVNAAAAGYFDRVVQGKYKLNPVGYNLVAHNLPSSSADSGSRGRSTTRKKPAKKAGAAKSVKPSKKAAPAKRSVATKSASR